MKDSPTTCHPAKLLRSGEIFILDVFTNTPAGKIPPRLAFPWVDCGFEESS